MNVGTRRSYRSFEFQLRIFFFFPSRTRSSFCTGQSTYCLSTTYFQRCTFFFSVFYFPHNIFFFFFLLLHQYLSFSALYLFVSCLNTEPAIYFHSTTIHVPFLFLSLPPLGSPSLPISTLILIHNPYILVFWNAAITFNLNVNRTFYGCPKKWRFCALLTLSFFFPANARGSGEEDSIRKTNEFDMVSLTGHRKLWQLTFQSSFPFGARESRLHIGGLQRAKISRRMWNQSRISSATPTEWNETRTSESSGTYAKDPR